MKRLLVILPILLPVLAYAEVTSGVAGSYLTKSSATATYLQKSGGAVSGQLTVGSIVTSSAPIVYGSYDSDSGATLGFRVYDTSFDPTCRSMEYGNNRLSIGNIDNCVGDGNLDGETYYYSSGLPVVAIGKSIYNSGVSFAKGYAFSWTDGTSADTWYTETIVQSSTPGIVAIGGGSSAPHDNRAPGGIQLRDRLQNYYAQIQSSQTMSSSYTLLLPDKPGIIGQTLEIESVSGSSLSIVFGTHFSTVTVSSNAILSGATFYHNAPTKMDNLNVTTLIASSVTVSGQLTTGSLKGGVGGSDTQVQFNDGGNFGGSAGLVYNKTARTLDMPDGGTGTSAISVGDDAGNGTITAGDKTHTGLYCYLSAQGGVVCDDGGSQVTVAPAGLFLSNETFLTPGQLHFNQNGSIVLSGPEMGGTGDDLYVSRGGQGLLSIGGGVWTGASGGIKLFGGDPSTNYTNFVVLRSSSSNFNSPGALTNSTYTLPTAMPTSTLPMVSDSNGYMAWSSTLAIRSLAVSSNAILGNATYYANGVVVGATINGISACQKYAITTSGGYWTINTVQDAALAAGLTQTITIGTNLIPANGEIMSLRIKHSTAFSGASITAMTVSAGDGTTTNIYAPDFNVFQSTANTTLWTDGGAMTTTSAQHSLTATFTSVGANLTAIAAGAVDIWACIRVLP